METKKQKIISIVATIGVILTLVGATYAYFQAQVGEGKSTDVNINASTVDVFTFATGDAVTISLDQDNFAQGTGSRTASTYASATLSANNKTNTATEHYYLYLNITNNSFDYTSEDSKPEILVKIKKNDIEVTSGISGLSYKTVTDAKGNTLTGFDITNKAGLITIADNTEITTTSTTEDNWNIEVTYVNHDFDQSANAGKSFSAKVLIQKEKQSLTLASWVKEEYAAQTVGNETIYYHDSTLENGAGDNSYRYSGSSSSVNNYVCFGSDEDTCPHDNLYRIIGVFDDRVRLIKADYATSAMLGTDTGDYYNIYSDAGYDTSYYQGESSNLTNIAGYYWNKVNYNASYNATNYYND